MNHIINNYTTYQSIPLLSCFSIVPTLVVITSLYLKQQVFGICTMAVSYNLFWFDKNRAQFIHILLVATACMAKLCTHGKICS